MLNLLHGDTNITENVRVKVFPGHTRGYQIVIIDNKDHPIIFLGDLSPYAVNFTRKAWAAAYDLEPQENIRSKTEIQNYAFQTGALLIFQHDTYIRSGYLTKNKKEQWEVEVASTGSFGA